MHPAVSSRTVALTRGRRLFFIALTLPSAGLIAFFIPRQGTFRDLDVFAPAGMAVTVTAATLLARLVPSKTYRLAVAAALALCALVPTVQALAHFADRDRGLERGEALAVGPPARSPSERAATWDFLGQRYLELRRWNQAIDAYEQVVREAPHRRTLLMLAIASTHARDFERARNAYQRVLTQNPDDPLGWLGLAGAALYLEDRVVADSSIARVVSYARDPHALGEMRWYIRALPQVWPTPPEVPPP
jgi:tetratricopeptide (TPR) repeat protein